MTFALAPYSYLVSNSHPQVRETFSAMLLPSW